MASSSVYDAYGAETTTGTAPTDACGYNAQWGYWLDRDTGLYLCQARWYDPVTGRWVTRDPIGYAGGANLYGYCGGGPVGWADLTGAAQILIILGAPLSYEGYWNNTGSEYFLQELAGRANDRRKSLKILRSPSETAVAVELSASDLEEIWVLGHCNSREGYMRLSGSGSDRKGITDSYFDAGLVSMFRRGSRKKLKKLWLIGCASVKQKADRDAYLTQTETLVGYEDPITFWDVRTGKQKPVVLTKPGPRDPVRRRKRTRGTRSDGLEKE